MSKRTKIWMLIAASLVAIGLLLIAGVMFACRWDPANITAGEYETNAYEIRDAFSNIAVNTDTAEVQFAASPDGRCRVECYERKTGKHSVDVVDGTLSVRASEKRAWYDYLNLDVCSPKVTVSLPESEYDALFVKESTGDILVENISVNSLALSVTTGDIRISDVACRGDITADVTTGAMDVRNVECRELRSGGSTGNVLLKSVTAAGRISLERTTGDIGFDRSDAGAIFVKTATGDVTGSLLSEKVFHTETATGNVEVPDSAAGGFCEIATSTGDIQMEIAK